MIDLILDNLKKNSFTISDNSTTLTFNELYKSILEQKEKIRNEIGCYKRCLVMANNSISFVIDFLATIYSKNLPIITNPTFSQDKIDYIVNKFSILAILNENKLKKLENMSKKEKLENEFLSLFTSGSTGDEKIVVLSEEAIYHNAKSVIENMNLLNPENIAIILPLYHSFALVTQLITTLITGGNIFIKDNKTFFGDLIAFIKDNKINTIAGVPTNFKMLLLGNNELFTSIKHITVAGAALEVSFAEKMKKSFPNAQIWVGYGLTESGPRVTAIEYNDKKFSEGSVGKPISDITTFISEEEILVKSNSNMLYYLDDDLNTNLKKKDNIIYSGDTGYLDEEGYLYIVGRKDDIFISGGEKISPLMIEKIINSYEGIENSVVFPENDSFLGKKPSVVIKIKNNCKVNPKELYNYCTTFLDKNIIPKTFYKTDEIPLTSNGKLKRNEVSKCKKEKLV